ncbi:MAG: hypothetical protein V1721_07590 [Pseudomonadota bacterium]
MSIALVLPIFMCMTYGTYLFDMRASNVCRNMKIVRPVLAQVFRVPERRIKLLPEDVATLFLTAQSSGSTARKAL